MWTPDVYEGAPTSVTAFFALAPKVAGFGAIIRILYIAFGNVFDEWQSILIFISVASMILGAVAAIGQTNIKRLMAYSSISHMGYGLAGLATGINEGVTASVLYIFLYVVMNIGSFACILIMKRKDIYLENIRDLSGLSKNHPLVAFCLTVMLFSLAGIPPLAGFFAKFYIFMAVVKADLIILAVIGLVTSVISAFYYLRIIKIMYFEPEQEKFDPISSKGVKIRYGFNLANIITEIIITTLTNLKFQLQEQQAAQAQHMSSVVANEAKKLVENHKVMSGLVISDHQKKGRGRFGNNWVSMKGNFMGSAFFPVRNYNSIDRLQYEVLKIILNLFVKITKKNNFKIKKPKPNDKKKYAEYSLKALLTIINYLLSLEWGLIL